MDATLSYAYPNVLSARDPDPVLLLYGEASRPVLLIADHAGNTVPEAMNGLGLDETGLTRHIAWDPDPAQVASGLAERWRATAVLAQYSRLIIDPNRPLGDGASIPEVSDGTSVPANQSLSRDERERRAALFFAPYHTAIDFEIARLQRVGPGPLVVSIHSFSPDYGEEARPWHVGIMAAADRRLADRLLDSLQQFEALVVGDNQPYSGVDLGYTLRLHGGAQGLANAQIEIRQDLLTDANDVTLWIDILDEALSPLIDDPALLAIEFY